MSEPDAPAPIVPHEQRTVDFYGDTITAFLLHRGDTTTIYVPLRPLCDYLGLNWSAQYRRVQRDSVLGATVAVMATVGADGKQREMICLPLDMLPGWLFGITSSRVRQDLQPKIDRYRRECFRVLWQAFQPQVAPRLPSTTPPASSGAALAYELATAVQHLARQQLELEQRIDKAAQWAHGVQRSVDDLSERVEILELTIHGDAPISEAQAAELALAVKQVGRALEAAGHKSGYSQVYAELYRRYAISSYKNLPRDQFAGVLAWLHRWHAELTGATP